MNTELKLEFSKPKESRTYFFCEIFFLALVLALIMDNMWLIINVPSALFVMSLCLLQIINCIRFWRREKDNSPVEQHPIFSNFFTGIALFCATAYLIGYSAINIYA